ncbi:hypothetical protein OK348_10740 [Flavobacterium sp. MXW15]|uniref:Uncharacterized protein n=1 Tax=Xanthomonas chitinilytica TaxID=2989819 RepID=A0ABT3JXC5_9XANT|nr:hypothetical protein [Xanthomonas sp. H13-6]MCW4455268.1 hypothetical protein [Flavobacterium sp. MXW15]MCW4473095.1 hypothetical protein [Xanthomonas sp. H13-6]
MRLPGGQGAALVLLLPLAACAKAPEVETTRTNEQGCTRLRSVGPQDPFQDPAPLKQACIGPYLLEIPQNYFYNQIGTEHDGSFSLALEYPSLEPFKPGERIGLTADVATRTVAIDYDFIDRIDVRQALRNAYTPMDFERDDPAESMEGRIEGEPVYGLIPYYADLPRIRDYYRSRDFADTTPVMQARWHTDWFVTRDGNGEVERIIKCTSREVTESGIDYRDGKIIKNKIHELPECDHFFILPEQSIRVKINYIRVALEEWQRIEQHAHDLLAAHLKNGNL